MLVLAAAIMTTGFALKAVVSHIGLFVLTVVIWTIGEIMLASLQPTVVAQLAPEDLRGRYLGAYNTLFGIATVLTGPLGGLVYERWGGRVLFAGCGAAGVVAVVLYAALARRLRTHFQPDLDGNRPV
jgi:MFS family permease